VVQARRWLQQAVSELACARWIGQGKMWAQACFFCQQASEKALKAVLVRAGQRRIRTHSIVRLLRQVSADQPAFGQLLAEAPRLDRDYIGTRYPNGMATTSELWEEQDFRQAESVAARIIELVEPIISAT
jgi:HEPN domain-containing protein